MQPNSDQENEICQPGRILRIKIENSMGYRYELVPKIIAITRKNDGEYWACSRYTDENFKRVIIKKKLVRKKVESLLSELRKLQIPASPQFITGCDGGFTELEIGNYDGKVLYRWWSEPRQDGKILTGSRIHS